MKKERLSLLAAAGFLALWMAPFIWGWLEEPRFTFVDVIIGFLVILAPALLTVLAFWRRKRDPYRHVITRWRWTILGIGLYAHVLALALLWGGAIIDQAYRVQWTPRVGEITMSLSRSYIAALLVAFICSLAGDGDGRFALGAASVLLIFLWMQASAAFL